MLGVRLGVGVVTYEGGGVGEDQSRGGCNAVGGDAHEGKQLARLDDQQHPQSGGACLIKWGYRGCNEIKRKWRE